MKTNRVQYVDLVKGFAILLMILVHTFVGRGYRAVLLIYSFHMPLFAVSNGYFFRKKGTGERIKTIIKRLFVPYLTTWFFITAIDAVKAYIDGTGVLTSLKTDFLCFIFGSGTEISLSGMDIGHCGPVWFLVALAVATIVFNCYVDSKFSFLISAVLAYTAYATASIKLLPFCIQQGLFLVLFINIGYLFRKYSLPEKPQVLLSVIPGMLALYVCMKKSTFLISSVTVPAGLCNIIWASVICIVIFFVFRFITEWKAFPPVLWKWGAWIGRNSLPLLVFHSIWCYAKSWRMLTDNLWLNIITELSVPVTLTVIFYFIPKVRFIFGYETIKKPEEKEICTTDTTP